MCEQRVLDGDLYEVFRHLRSIRPIGPRPYWLRVMPSRFLLVLCVAVCSCGRTGYPGPVSPSGGGSPAPAPAASNTHNELLLVFDEAVIYRDLQLRWINLDDSRCAIGVTCVWEGEAVVTIEVTHGAAEPAVVKMTSRPGPEPEVTAIAGYAMSVLDVNPYPEQDVTPGRSDFLLRLGINPL